MKSFWCSQLINNKMYVSHLSDFYNLSVWSFFSPVLHWLISTGASFWSIHHWKHKWTSKSKILTLHMTGNVVHCCHGNDRCGQGSVSRFESLQDFPLLQRAVPREISQQKLPSFFPHSVAESLQDHMTDSLTLLAEHNDGKMTAKETKWTNPFKDGLLQMWDVSHPPLWVLMLTPVLHWYWWLPEHVRSHAQVDL